MGFRASVKVTILLTLGVYGDSKVIVGFRVRMTAKAVRYGLSLSNARGM